MNATPPVPRFQPQTLEDALRLWGAHGAETAGDGLDYSRLAEMMGIHRLGGVISIGLNTTLAGIVHASLVRVGATCLAEACERTYNPGATLLSQLFAINTFSLAALALITLDAEIETAWMQPGAGVQRGWSSLALALNPNPDSPARMCLNVRMAAHERKSGSALVVADVPVGMTPLALAAAVTLSLDVETERVVACRMALLPAQGQPLRLSSAESTLLGQPISYESIDAAAHAAQTQSQDSLWQLLPEHPYRTNTTAHLLRQAIDHAGARIRANAY